VRIEAPISDTAEDRGWLTGDLVVFCLACTAVTVFAGLIQVSFGAFTMTIEQAWRAVFNPQVIFNPTAWEAFLFGSELPEMNRRSLIVWNIRLPASSSPPSSAPRWPSRGPSSRP